MTLTNSKTSRILHLIGSTGSKGMRFTDIQRALWEMTPPEVHAKRRGRFSRGYWCTNLLGGHFYHCGLLYTFCEKNAEGRWVLARPIPAHPWTHLKCGI